MRKFIFWVAAAFTFLTLLTGCASSSDEETDNNTRTEAGEAKYDFRYANFGDSAKKIKSREPLEITDETKDGLLVGDAECAGFPATAIYKIDPVNGFYEGVYWLNNPHNYGSSYIDDYEKLKESFTKVYGEPTSDKANIIDPRSEGLTVGEALELGYLFYETIWDAGSKKMTLFMVKESGVINTVLSYEPKDIKPSPNTGGI